MSNMGETFDDILIECKETSQKLSKNFYDDDWELKLNGVGHFGEVNSLRVDVDGKMKTPSKIIFRSLRSWIFIKGQSSSNI